MWRCGSCVFFKSHKPVTPGAGGNSECLRTPGYYRSGVMDACAFYAKKGKKVAKKKIPTMLEEHCNKKMESFTCSECGETDHVTANRVPGIEGFVCYRCLEHLKADRPAIKDVNWVKEIPVYERYLVVEGRGAWPCTNVYTHDFTNLEGALKFVSRFRPDSCKMFKVTAASPITLEELSLGCDIKVTSTHVMEVPTK